MGVRVTQDIIEVEYRLDHALRVTQDIVEIEYRPEMLPPTDCGAAWNGVVIHVSWIDHATNEEGYHIERQVDYAAWILVHTTVANVTSWDDIDVATGHVYRYRIMAFDYSQDTEPCYTVEVETGRDFAFVMW